MLDHLHQIHRPLGIVEQIAHTLLDLAREEQPMRHKIKQVTNDDYRNQNAIARESKNEKTSTVNCAKHDTETDEMEKEKKRMVVMRELRDTVRAQSLPAWKKALGGWDIVAVKDIESLQNLLQKRWRVLVAKGGTGNQLGSPKDLSEL